jgi:hypothetical protein
MLPDDRAEQSDPAAAKTAAAEIEQRLTLNHRD